MEAFTAYTFCYDAARQTWAESHIPAFASENGNNLPVVLVVDYYDRRSGDSRIVTWCGEHHAYEPVASYTEDGLLTGGTPHTTMTGRIAAISAAGAETSTTIFAGR